MSDSAASGREKTPFANVPFTDAELLLALLLLHRAVAVQVVEAPALLPALPGGGAGRAPVLFALARLQDGGHVLPSVSGDVGHVFAPSSSCEDKPKDLKKKGKKFNVFNNGNRRESILSRLPLFLPPLKGFLIIGVEVVFRSEDI